MKTNKGVLMALVALIVLGGASWWLFLKPKVAMAPVPLTPVKMKLKWMHQAQFAGNYVAIEKGFYKDEGLDMTVEPFAYTDSTVDNVISGKSDFGVAGAEELLVARAAGKPVKAFAVIYKRNPVAAYALKSSGITKPQDFIGKTVGIERGINVEYLYAAMMGKLKIDRKKIKEVSVGYDASELLSGKVDVSSGYIINEPQLVVEAGKEVNTILMGDYGVNMYADVLFTTDDTIKNKPELVQKVLNATLKGWQYAFEHQDEAVNMTMKYATTSTKAHQAHMLAASVPLINTGTSKLGWMDGAEWSAAQNILFEQKVMKKKINISDAYTMQFLDALYK